MIRKTYRKNIFREIKSTLNRFIAIFAITALGAGFYAGLKATGPDMRHTADVYFSQQQLMDFRLVSTFGFTQDDIAELEKLPEVDKVMAGYGMDMLVEAPDGVDAVTLRSLPGNVSAENAGYLNRIVLTEGRMPATADECVADAETKDRYKVGDTLTISAQNDEDSLDMLAEKTFTIVGLAESPAYISFQRGNTTIGDGTIEFFVYVPQSSFDSEYYTEVFVTAAGSEGISAFSEQYGAQIDNVSGTLETFGEERAKVRYDEINEEGTQELDDARKELADKQAEADEKLAEAAQKLADGEKEIKNGWAEIAANQKKLDDGEAQLTSGEAASASARSQLESGQKEYDSSLVSFSQQKAIYDGSVLELQTSRQQLETMQQGIVALQPVPGQIEQLDAAVAPLEDLEQQGLLDEAGQAQLAALREQRQQAVDGFVGGMGQMSAGLRQFADGLETMGQAEQAAGLRTAADTADSLAAAGGTENYNMAVSAVSTAASGISTALDAAQAVLDENLPALQAGEAQLVAAKATLDSGWQQLAAGEAQLATARAELADGKTELAKGRSKLVKAQKELDEGKQEYETQKAEAEEKLEDARYQLEDAQKKLDDLERPTWYVWGRDKNPGYSGFGTDTSRIDAIAKIFPVFFFLVAALVCLTTMTRMVEDQRTQIGTLKALGFTKGSIAFKYIFYAGVASVTGSLFGVLVGFVIFPGTIFSAYQMMYILPSINRDTHFALAFVGVAASVLCTTLATVGACYNELRSVPAQLMRPKAPKPGKRVLLERIPAIWSRFSFSNKVTVRNLFRYKKRFLMTVIGVAGCTALLLTGFGLRDSIAGISGQQYGEIYRYDMMVYPDDASMGAADTPLNKKLAQLGESIYVSEDAVEVESAGGNSTDMTVKTFVMEDPEKMEGFVNFQNRKTQQKIDFPQGDGVIITEKLSSRLKADVGDTIEVGRTGGEKVAVKVAGVMENYVLNYVYMTPAVYQMVFEQQPEYNTVLLKLAEEQGDNHKQVLEDLVKTRGVASAVDVADMTGYVDKMMESLNKVIWVVVLAAGALAVVVLYNLTNINITERVREIATLKVLGFYNGEVAQYVFRENFVLTLISIVVGLAAGVVLHRYVILTAEVDEVMFRRMVEPLSYLLAAVFTLLATTVVSLVMTKTLRKIDMVESLKSAE